MVWVWFVCFLFSANLTPGCVFVNLCSHAHVLHLMGALLCLTILTLCCVLLTACSFHFLPEASAIHIAAPFHPFTYIFLSIILSPSSFQLFPPLYWCLLSHCSFSLIFQPSPGVICHLIFPSLSSFISYSFWHS